VGRAISSIERACQFLGAGHRPSIPAVICNDEETISSGGGSSTWSLFVPVGAYDHIATSWAIIGSVVNALPTISAQTVGYAAVSAVSSGGYSIGPHTLLQVTHQLAAGTPFAPGTATVNITLTNNGTDSGSMRVYALGVVSHGRQLEEVTL